MNKEKIQAVVDDVFKRYPHQEKLFVTSDGQAFFEESHAKNHSVKNRTGKELDVLVFKAPTSPDPSEGGETGGKTSSPVKTAKDLIAEIQSAETVEAVTALLDAEKSGGNRKTVVEAAEKRIVELSKNDEQ